jgi:PAS domain S-box-containing protein
MTLSPEGRVLFVNQKWSEIFGISRLKASGKVFSGMLPASEGESFKNNFLKLPEYGNLLGALSVPAGAGGVKIVSFDLQAVENAEGKITYIRCFAQDITAQKKAAENEEILKQSEKRFQLIFENLGTANAIFDGECRLVINNRLYYSYFDLPECDLRGKKPGEIFDSRIGEVVEKRIRKIFSSGNSDVFETEFNYKGKKRWLHSVYSPVLSAEAAISGVQIISRDITDIKQALVQLLREQEFNRAMLENAADGVIACDENGRLVVFNKVARYWHGLPASDITQDQWATYYSLYHNDAATLMRQDEIPLVRAFNGEQVHNSGLVIKAAGKPPRRVNCNAAAFYDAEGRKIGAVIVMSDITASTKIEENLLASFKKLQDLDHYKSNFISMVSHELRTPLTSIKGFVSFLQKGAAGELNTKQAEFVGVIENNVERQIKLVNELLDLDKMEKGIFPLRKKSHRITEIMDGAISDIYAMAAENKISFEKEYSRLPVTANVDDYRISQVFMNVLSNAIKFSPEGSGIAITIAPVKPDEIKTFHRGFNSSLAKGCVMARIKDNGRGIDEENIEKIFDKFFQVGNDRQNVVKGSGLGLSIALGIVRAHGGLIWAESDGAGKGTAVIIVLPLE